MLRNIQRKLSLALTLAAIAVPYGSAIAQSASTKSPSVVTGTNPEPQVVTGTNPEPQVIAIILLSMITSA
jgi:hypothetical protein